MPVSSLKGTMTLRKLGRIFFIILCLCLLTGAMSLLAPKASAASNLTASESCVDFVKKVEGFSQKPYYDYGQHTVGYGTKCPTDKYFEYMANGIPRSEAEALLRQTLAEVSDTVNKKLVQPYGLTFTQHQFDALVSFSFNIGTAWMTYNSTLRDALLAGAGADDLVYAFSLYCTAGGKYSSGLITRRLCEANMYLNGVYSQTISDAYGYVFYEANGGTLTYRVQGYICNSNTAPVADAQRNSDVFLGWYTDLSGGTQVQTLTLGTKGKTLFARWASSESTENQDSGSTLITVTGDVVNIRKGPGTNYGVARQVTRNDILILSHVSDLTNTKWGKVQDGWICLDYTNYNTLLNGNDTGNTTSPSQPSDQTPVPDETPPEGSSSSTTQSVITGIVRVNDLLRIRSGPGTAYSTVGYLFNGQPVEILEQKTVGTMIWGRMERGWVCMDYIVTEPQQKEEPSTVPQEPEQTPEETPSTTPEQTPEQPSEQPSDDSSANTSANSQPTTIRGQITADALRIRAGAGTAYPIVGFYRQNDVVSITEKVLIDSAYWGKTNLGWISMDYVSVAADLPTTETTTPSVSPSVSPSDSPSDSTSGSSSVNPSVNLEKTVTGDCLRIRKEIGTNQAIVGFLYRGDRVTILETRIIDGIPWGRISQGWICMNYVD